ncbi:hypothetical protein GLYMA_05G241650v4 [Glycine max]|nr:hypothetical protein GLYMA_05G241650v4 [Glycine max]
MKLLLLLLTPSFTPFHVAAWSGCEAIVNMSIHSTKKIEKTMLRMGPKHSKFSTMGRAQNIL